MTLPRPPISHSTAIPNQPFSTPEVYYLEGNQGHLPLGSGLYIDPATGKFTDIEPSPYIYCTPQYSNLPVTYPPYGCNTEVNTTGVTSFQDAWIDCSEITEFPCVDSSLVTDFCDAWAFCYGLTSFPLLNTGSGSNFTYSWGYCTGLTSFPLLDTGAGENFTYAWISCSSLETFPLIDTSSGTTFWGTWKNCTSLTSFPSLDTSSGTTFWEAWKNCTSLTSFPSLDTSSGVDFGSAWWDCTNLTSFPLLDVSSAESFQYSWYNCTSLVSFSAGMFDNCPANYFVNAWKNCALSGESVDNILSSLDNSGQSNGIVNIDGGTSSAPGAAGLAAKSSLEARGWTVTTN